MRRGAHRADARHRPSDGVHSRTMSSTPPGGLHSVEWVRSAVASTQDGGLHSVEWCRGIAGEHHRTGRMHRVRSVAGLTAAVRSGLLRAVRLLVVRVRRLGVSAQLLADQRAGEDGTVVLERDAEDLSPGVLARGPERSRLAGVGWGLPVRVGRRGRRSAAGRGRRTGPTGRCRGGSRPPGRHSAAGPRWCGSAAAPADGSPSRR